jgi:hypothetical protein
VGLREWDGDTDAHVHVCESSRKDAKDAKPRSVRFAGSEFSLLRGLCACAPFHRIRAVRAVDRAEHASPRLGVLLGDWSAATGVVHRCARSAAIYSIPDDSPVEIPNPRDARAGQAVAPPTFMTNVTDQREMAELIDLFFKCIKAPPRTERHLAYGTAFNAKLEEHVSESPTEDMRAFARQVSALGTIPYTRAFSQVVQIRGLAR